jgi:single-strand DNA-binding protein
MNTIQLIGRLTADPELRYTSTGNPVCTIRLAVPRRSRATDPDPAPVYVNVVSYGGQAEAVANHMAKGRRVAVTGRLEHRQWTSDEVRHSMHEVIAREVEFLDAPPAAPAAAQADGSDEEPF